MKELAIKSIIDTSTGSLISSADFFQGKSDDFITLEKAKITKAHLNSNNLYTCGLCGSPVYISSGGIIAPHFKHWSSEKGTEFCPWKAGENKNPDNIDSARFSGKGEGEAHFFYRTTLKDILSSDERFSSVDTNSFFKPTDLSKFPHGRYPDVIGRYEQGKNVVFEVQLANSQIPKASERDLFYAQEETHLIWVFANFESTRHMEALRNIFVQNRNSAFELNDEAILMSRTTKKLHLKAWWIKPSLKDGKITKEWVSKIIDFSEMEMIDPDFRPYFGHFYEDLTKIIEVQHSPALKMFKGFWITEDYTDKGIKTSAQYYDELKSFCDGDSPNKNWEDANNENFFRALVYLHCIENNQPYGKMNNLKSTVNIILDKWPKYTEAVLATLRGYNQQELLREKGSSVKTKIIANMSKARIGDSSYRQAREYHTLIRLLFPATAKFLKS